MDSWFGRVFKKSFLTKGLLSKMINVFSSTGLQLKQPLFSCNSLLHSADPITQVVCDDTKHILYVLTASSKLVVYDLGARGDRFYQVASYSSHQLQVESKAVDHPNCKLISERNRRLFQHRLRAAARRDLN